MKKELIKELENLAFEDALKRLETIVDKMEDGNLSLDRMMTYFEEGSALSNICGRKLKELEKKIEVLVKETSEGGEWKDFDSSSERQDSALSATEKDDDELEEGSLF